MGTLRHLGDPTPVELSFQAAMSQELIERYIDEHGERPNESWTVDFDLRGVDDPGLRRRLREAHKRYDKAKFFPTLPRVSADPAEFLEDLEPWLDQNEKEEDEARQEKAEAEEAEKAAAEVFREAMREWVPEHGSRRLKLATEGGYRIYTSYAIERAEKELPGFWVDTAEDCEWGERVDPTEEALILEEETRKRLQEVDPELKASIVWLTETPRALDDEIEEEDLEFEAQEAILVEGYLGRYRLVMPLDSELRPNKDAA